MILIYLEYYELNYFIIKSMKKIFLIIIIGFFSITDVFWDYNNTEFKNINFEINNKIISWELLYTKLEKSLDITYLDPVNKMNLSNDFIIKLSEIKLEKARDLEWVFQELWNKYSKEVLENKRNNYFTVLEWWNIFDIDTALTQRSLITKWDYISYVENREKIIALSEFFPFLDNQKTLEWYLYPDTYKINPLAFQINNFVILQLNTFEEKVYNTLFIDEITKEPLYINSIIESVVNLASIVEKEERNKSEQKTVAWILKKRLKEYRQLWADITTCYPYRLTSNQCKLVISKYVKIKTDYNTRIILWLPPTPINNPSFTTIDNTLNSQDSQYYYYLHDTNWQIYYWKDYEEHKENIEKYLQ